MIYLALDEEREREMFIGVSNEKSIIELGFSRGLAFILVFYARLASVFIFVAFKCRYSHRLWHQMVRIRLMSNDETLWPSSLSLVVSVCISFIVSKVVITYR